MGNFVQFSDRKERTDPGIKNGEFSTDVEGVNSNGEYYVGTESFPIFDVDHEDFAGSYRGERRKVRWNTTSVSDYSQKSINGRSFFVRYNDQLRKIK